MSGNSNKAQTEKLSKPDTKTDTIYLISCACCNNDITDKAIGIVYYGTMINLCGNPCGIRDYLETQ